MAGKITMTYVFEKLKLDINTDNSSFNIPCPVCLDEKPKNKLMHISLEKNVFRCPRCESSGGPVHFYGLLKYGYTKEYINGDKTVRDKLYHELSGGSTDLTGTAYERKEFVRKDVPPAPIAERDRTYNRLIDRLKLSDAHYNNLVNRGLREKDIIENRYVSTPKLGFTKYPAELRKEACDLLGVPGFYKKGEIWTLHKVQNGFFIPARDLSENPSTRLGLIQGMQVRFDTVSETDPRYKWLSTKDMESGCSAETYAHFVGFPEQTVILTEGPLKGDIIYRFLQIPVIAIPGVNCLNNLKPLLEKLWKLGVRRIMTAFDMDYKQNINVQDAYVNLILCLEEYGFYVERYLWDENFKGLDDFLLQSYLSRGGRLDTLK